MGLKRIVSALLPRDYREQIVGDLEERGFRPRDVLSVLPSVWWSCMLRASAVPNLTGANETSLRHRSRQFRRRSGLGWTAIIVLYILLQLSILLSDGVSFAGVAILAFILVTAFTGAMALYHFYRLLPLPLDRDGWLQHHRQQLQKALGRSFAVLPFCTQLVGTEWMHSAWRFAFLVIVIGLIYSHHRRLKKELETLS